MQKVVETQNLHYRALHYLIKFAKCKLIFRPYLPVEVGNDTQGGKIEVDLKVTATQVENTNWDDVDQDDAAEDLGI